MPYATPRLLTGEQARDIVLREKTGAKQRDLAERFGVSVFLINSIVRGLAYQDETGAPVRPRRKRSRPRTANFRAENKRRIHELVVALQCIHCGAETTGRVGSAIDHKYGVGCSNCDGRRR